MNDIKLADKGGRFLFSFIYDVKGKDLLLQESGMASLAGTPNIAVIGLHEPYAVYANPGKPISKKKNYRVIIIESDS